MRGERPDELNHGIGSKIREGFRKFSENASRARERYKVDQYRRRNNIAAKERAMMEAGERKRIARERARQEAPQPLPDPPPPPPPRRRVVREGDTTYHFGGAGDSEAEVAPRTLLTRQQRADRAARQARWAQRDAEMGSSTSSKNKWTEE
jgi:hypothetical protein